MCTSSGICCRCLLSQVSTANWCVQVEYAAGVVHDNIVQLLDVFVEGDQYVIVVRQSPSCVHTHHFHACELINMYR